VAVIFKFGLQEIKVHGEIRGLHLVSEILSYGILGMGTAAEGDGETVKIGRPKKRKPNQVIPVGMGEEKSNTCNIFFLSQSLT
jgi:alpha-acetolactate decarboxylase